MTSRAVVTLTAAGAIDATYRVASLEPGQFTRAAAYEREVSGKGVNLSGALRHAGVPTAAVVVLGEDDLAFAGHSEHAAILRPVAVPGATRVNTSIIDALGATTKVNAPTPALAAEAWRRAVEATLDEIDALDASWLVVCGTVPVLEGETVPADVLPLIRAARERGVRVGLDTSGPALAGLTGPGAEVSLIKPNTAELAELTGRSLQTVGDVVDAARSVIERGVETLYVSMGADGALGVTAERTVHALARAPRLANTAGAGDASLAGFLEGLTAAGEDPLSRAVATAARWGAHAVAQTSTLLPHLDGLPEAVVTVEPDRGSALGEPATA